MARLLRGLTGIILAEVVRAMGRQLSAGVRARGGSRKTKKGKRRSVRRKRRTGGGT